MAVYDRLCAALTGADARVVLPETDDPRIAEAADILTRDGLATVVPVAEDGVAYVDVIRSRRPKTSEAMARRMLERPLFRAAAMVAAGDADAMVAGAANATRKVIEAAGLTIGPADGVKTVSSFFLMSFPSGREVIFADCAVNVDPNEEALADIAIASHASATALLGSAQVAMLSYSTLASGTGPSVDKVAATVERLKGRLDVVGPVQADAALSADVAAKKGIAGGDANTLIFPDLDAGNCDLSRGARVDDIVKATVITLALAKGQIASG